MPRAVLAISAKTFAEYPELFDTTNIFTTKPEVRFWIEGVILSQNNQKIGAITSIPYN